MEWVETTAATIADAKDRALDRLGVHEDEAEFEVVAEGRTGLFGRVKEEARVRARVRPRAPRAKDERRRRGKGGGRGAGSNRGQKGQGRSRGDGGNGSQKGGRSRDSGKGQDTRDAGRGAKGKDSKAGGPGGGQQKGRDRNDGKKQSRSAGAKRSDNQEKTVTDNAPTMPLSEQADIAQDFVEGLAERFGSEVELTRENVADDEIRITVSGDDLGRMIGRRGSTAMAIDELVRTVLQRQAGSSRDGRVRVDVGGVRARRAEALKKFCAEQAELVRDSGVARSLEPMGGADRKVVHDSISDEDGVATISEGEDPNRRVVIIPAGDG